MTKNIEKYAVELDDYECDLILDNAVVFGQLKATLTRMSKREGIHTIQMSLNEINDLGGKRVRSFANWQATIYIKKKTYGVLSIVPPYKKTGKTSLAETV